MRFDRNDYSVPTAFAHHEVTALGGIEEVRILVGTEVVATHPRCWGKEQISFDPRHYLALLERKPGALDYARPLEGWDLPECFSHLRRRLEADLGSAGTREYIKVLRLMERATLARAHRSRRGGALDRGDRRRRRRLILFHRAGAPGRAVQPGRPPAPEVRRHRTTRPRRLQDRSTPGRSGPESTPPFGAWALRPTHRLGADRA